jgi:hypothetical protein
MLPAALHVIIQRVLQMPQQQTQSSFVPPVHAGHLVCPATADNAPKRIYSRIHNMFPVKILTLSPVDCELQQLPCSQVRYFQLSHVPGRAQPTAVMPQHHVAHGAHVSTRNSELVTPPASSTSNSSMSAAFARSQTRWSCILQTPRTKRVGGIITACCPSSTWLMAATSAPETMNSSRRLQKHASRAAFCNSDDCTCSGAFLSHAGHSIV